MVCLVICRHIRLIDHTNEMYVEKDLCKLTTSIPTKRFTLKINQRITFVQYVIVTLTKMFAFLEKERHSPDNDHLDNDWQLTECLDFCGFVPFELDNDWEDDSFMAPFVEEVRKDPFLMNKVIEAFDTISQVALYFPEYDDLQEWFPDVKCRMFNRFFKSHINELPKHLYLQEINGGIGSASEHRIRYFQNNKEDHDNDSDNDSEDSDEIMTASQMIQISDRSAIATITECIFLLRSDRIHFSEVKTQEDWIVIYQMEKLRDHMASSLGFESEFRMPFASQNRS